MLAYGLKPISENKCKTRESLWSQSESVSNIGNTAQYYSWQISHDNSTVLGSCMKASGSAKCSYIIVQCIIVILIKMTTAASGKSFAKITTLSLTQ